MVSTTAAYLFVSHCAQVIGFHRLVALYTLWSPSLPTSL